MTKIGDWNNPAWVEKYSWGCTSDNHVWECCETGLYHYSDEASQIDIYGYKTQAECKSALDAYAAAL